MSWSIAMAAMPATGDICIRLLIIGLNPIDPTYWRSSIVWPIIMRRLPKAPAPAAARFIPPPTFASTPVMPTVTCWVAPAAACWLVASVSMSVLTRAMTPDHPSIWGLIRATESLYRSWLMTPASTFSRINSACWASFWNSRCAIWSCDSVRSMRTSTSP
jgi:hypothetical protein